MKRRTFIAGLGSAAAWPIVARAQRPTLPVVVFLNSAWPDGYAPMVAAFRQGLKEIGYVEGQNVAVEYRWAEGQYDRVSAMAAELVRRQVAVIVANTPGTMAVKAATATIPIVFTTARDPVEMHLHRPHSQGRETFRPARPAVHENRTPDQPKDREGAWPHRAAIDYAARRRGDRMRRREFIAGLGGAAAWPLVARGQQRERVRRAGVLLSFAEDDPEEPPRLAALRRELERLGWSEGRNLHIDIRYAAARADQFSILAKQLIAFQRSHWGADPAVVRRRVLMGGLR